ncbi:hypothetical protein GBAR_LOCUS4528, partial [Geodia barretti]
FVDPAAAGSFLFLGSQTLYRQQSIHSPLLCRTFDGGLAVCIQSVSATKLRYLLFLMIRIRLISWKWDLMESETYKSQMRMMLTVLLVSTFSLLFNCVSGILTCGGCISDDINNEYYCREAERYIYFRCESNLTQLEWSVSPLFGTNVILNALDEEDNIIRRGGVSIFVDTIDITSSKSQIISYLWLNLEEMDSEIRVTCINDGVFYWVLKPSGESTLKPNITDAYFVRDPNSEEVSVFYKWDYPNFREILGYNVKTFLDGQPISSISLPKASMMDLTMSTFPMKENSVLKSRL